MTTNEEPITDPTAEPVEVPVVVPKVPIGPTTIVGGLAFVVLVVGLFSSNDLAAIIGGGLTAIAQGGRIGQAIAGARSIAVVAKPIIDLIAAIKLQGETPGGTTPGSALVAHAAAPGNAPPPIIEPGDAHPYEGDDSIHVASEGDPHGDDGGPTITDEDELR